MRLLRPQYFWGIGPTRTWTRLPRAPREGQEEEEAEPLWRQSTLTQSSSSIPTPALASPLPNMLSPE